MCACSDGNPLDVQQVGQRVCAPCQVVRQQRHRLLQAVPAAQQQHRLQGALRVRQGEVQRQGRATAA